MLYLEDVLLDLTSKMNEIVIENEATNLLCCVKYQRQLNNNW